MADHPILFSAPMVRAILAGTKTQTRRVVKWRNVDPGLNLQFSGLRTIRDHAGLWALESDARTSRETRCDVTPCPYGMPGDRLWVRETWAAPHRLDGHTPRFMPPTTPVHYAASEDRGGLLWRPSIHMPRWASRITLEITNVRVERLQVISEADARSEGVKAMPGMKWHSFAEADAGIPMHDHTARDAFHALWETINGADSWDANPWVWVVEFKRAGH
jgi:hypothetical protein